MIYLTTDWHLCHKNIIRFENRPYNFEDKILKNHCALKEHDILINLGDVYFSHDRKVKPIMDKLVCRKFLCKGNHDRKSIHWYMNNGFDFACDFFIKDGIVFSHIPLPKIENTEYNIHGHFHTNSHSADGYKFYDPRYHKCLSIEEENYSPILLEKFVSKKLDLSMDA